MYRIRWLAALAVIFLLAMQHVYAGSSILSRDSVFREQGGAFSIGFRTTVNVFTNAPKCFGMGAGSSVRLQLLRRLNTEWFADYVTSNLYNKANRTDAHIGWNVMYYILDPKDFKRRFTPFVAAGHCFDYTGIRLNGTNQPMHDRWTSAVQISVGYHYNITQDFDISLSTLYDLHLGKEVDADMAHDGNLIITENSNAGWEGHIMIIFSAHYKIARLWKPKR